MPGDKAEDTKKIWTCSSCARSIRGRYRVKKLDSSVDFACAMGKGPSLTTRFLHKCMDVTW